MHISKKNIAICCTYALCVLSASARTDTPLGSLSWLDVNALQRFSQGINIGKITVDSAAITSDSVKIFLNDALQNVPMRPDNVAAINKAIADGLPSSLTDKALVVFVNGYRLESLIPECYRPKYGDMVRLEADRCSYSG